MTDDKTCADAAVRVSMETVQLAHSYTNVFIYKCVECGRVATSQMPEYALRDLRRYACTPAQVQGAER